jgi:Concanavalin A-like lectin/glucanases superfamily
MSRRAAREREIREISIAANSGEASEAQLARLDQLICEDPQSASYAASVFDQQASLAWHGSMCDSPHSSPRGTAGAPASAHPPGDVANNSRRPSASLRTGWSWPTIAVGVAFVLGAVASPSLRPASWEESNDSLDIVAAAHPATEPTYEARFTRSTACLWASDSAGSREIGSWLSSGESLHLLEGLAEFTLEWSGGGSATLSLEGPAAMMLTSQGMPTLRFGRLTAVINTPSRPFVLETPVGRLVVSDFGSIGVSAFGNDGELHVFDGAATLEPAWRSTTGQQNVPSEIQVGEAIRVQEGPSGELDITRHAADEDFFVAQVSMTSDALIVPPAYVAAVTEANPVGYWRFERDAWPRVPNQMGPRFECKVNGALGVAAYQANHAVEFGVTDQGGEILCNDLLDDEITDSYSIEFWIKPSHYHLGAVVSLVGDPETPNGVIPHGMLLEMGGTGLIPRAVHHPGRVRFLHRSPASNDSDQGTSCYSTDSYTLRKWQHVVTVKDSSRMRLYIDGVLAGEGEDFTELPAGMRLLLGGLYPSRRVRPYIGQLDELAIYNRALKPQEIKRHYHLLRPQIAGEPSI